MQRSWVWVVALGTSLVAFNPIHVIDAATWLPGAQNGGGAKTDYSAPPIEVAEAPHPGGGGGGRGPSGVAGGGPHGPGPVGGGPPGVGGPHGPIGGGAFVHGGGALHRGGVGPRILAPGGAGSRFAAPRFHTGPGVVTPRILSPYGHGALGRMHGMPRFTPRPGIVARLGVHYPRYHHRHGRFHYYYGGWWYAYPWWTYGGYDYGNSCSYRARYCARRWGWHTRRYYACLRYYGCY